MTGSHETLRRWMIRRGHSRRTASLYCGYVRRFHDWTREQNRGSKALWRLQDAQDYALTLPATYASRAGFQNALRCFWRHAGADPAPLTALPVPPRPEMVCRALPVESVPTVIARAREFSVRAWAAVALMYYAGLRVEEACQLRWESDRGDELIVVGKGGRTRYQPIVPELREALDALPRVGPWLFMGRGGRGPICTETARQWVRLAGAAAGLGRIVPHQLRHSSGATIYDTTQDLRGTAVWLGHSPNSLSITMGYTRTRRERLHALGAVLSRRTSMA